MIVARVESGNDFPAVSFSLSTHPHSVPSTRFVRSAGDCGEGEAALVFDDVDGQA